MTLKKFFLGNAGARNNYYSARHKSEDIYLLWIESDRFGKIFTFPCVIEEQGDPMVYISGGGLAGKQKNAAVINRWNLMVKPRTFGEEYVYTELAGEEFQKEYGAYKNEGFRQHMEGVEAGSLPEGEKATGEPAEEPSPEGDDSAQDAPESAPDTGEEN